MMRSVSAYSKNRKKLSANAVAAMATGEASRNTARRANSNKATVSPSETSNSSSVWRLVSAHQWRAMNATKVP